MTRKVTLLGLALALLVPAQASAAQFPPLNEDSARRLALKLAREVAVERQVRWWNLSPALKVRPNRVVFAYTDRPSATHACAGRVVVERSSTLRRAFFAGSRCARIPDEALGLERATAAMIRAVQPRLPAVERSLRRYARELRDCARLVVPRSRRDDVRRLLEIGEALALLDPLLPQLDAFVTGLQNVHPEDPELVRAVAAWRRLLILVEALPPAARDGCTAAREWAANAYSSDTAPLDFEELRRTIEALRRQELVIVRGAARLFELGVSPRVVSWFSLEALAGD